LLVVVSMATDKKNISASERHLGIWSSIVRGAIGGFCGAFIFFGYAIYRNPYGIMNLASFFPFLWIAIIAGLLVGAIVWLFGRFRGTNVGLLWRVAIGIAVSVVVIAPYLYLTKHPGDVEPWWKYSRKEGFDTEN
jgi:hypothetical protein